MSHHSVFFAYLAFMCHVIALQHLLIFSKRWQHERTNKYDGYSDVDLGFYQGMARALDVESCQHSKANFCQKQGIYSLHPESLSRFWKLLDIKIVYYTSIIEEFLSLHTLAKVYNLFFIKKCTKRCYAEWSQDLPFFEMWTRIFK